MGGGGGGERGDAGPGRTNTSLCPSTADGEGQICSILPGEPVRETGYERGQRAASLTDPIVPPESSDRTSSEPALTSCSLPLFWRLFLCLISVSHSSSKFRFQLSRSRDLKYTFSRGNWNFGQIFLCSKFLRFDLLFPSGSPPGCASRGHVARYPAVMTWT